MTESDIRYAFIQNWVLESLVTRFVKSCLSSNKKPINHDGLSRVSVFLRLWTLSIVHERGAGIERCVYSLERVILPLDYLRMSAL